MTDNKKKIMYPDDGGLKKQVRSLEESSGLMWEVLRKQFTK